MALGIINYAFLLTAVVVGFCSIITLGRYFEHMSTITLLFVLFLISYVINAFIFFIRGLLTSNTIGDMILFKWIQVLYVFMAIFLAMFLLYPMLSLGESSPTNNWARPTTVFFILISILDLVVITISDVIWTYDDPYGLPHYALESFIPYTYYVVLGLILVMAIFSMVMFALMTYRETDPFYKQRATMLFVGWVLIVFGQTMMLSSSLSILNPFISLPGVVLMAISIIRRQT